MSFIKMQHIVSFSSEDKSFPADNLLKSAEYKKWICAKGGEKQASIVLQFEKASSIHGLDIGNEGSAFIEVLVGRLSDNEQNYKVLLVASSFMSPIESRNGTNMNRVRMFGLDKFTKDVADEKWDRVKIVCTQPFNKTAQYGLTFIKFHSSDSQANVSKEEPSSETQRFGAFALRDDSKETPLAPGSLFSRTKESSSTSSNLKGALDIRAASTKAEAELLGKAPSGKANSATVPSKRKTQTTEEIEPDNKKAKQTPSKSQSPPAKEKISSKTPAAEKKQTSNTEAQSPEVPAKGSKTAAEHSTPLHKLLSGVVFVLSGFQNPQRSDLRDKALEMGAKYRPDWGDGCTHLICAFPNTPKFQQVKSARGKIVSKQWILDCHKRKASLSWRHYKLKGKNGGSSDSSDETTSQPPSRQQTRKETRPRSADSEKTARTPQKKASGDVEDDYGGSTDVDSSPPGGRGNEDETDTDVEIERVMQSRDRAQQALSPLPDTSEMVFPELPDFFRGSGFFLYGQFGEQERRLLLRYIVAFNGKVEDYMNDKVAYVITASKWDDNFDEALTTNSNLIFAQPKWIHACALKQKAIPHQPYVIVPQ